MELASWHSRNAREKDWDRPPPLARLAVVAVTTALSTVVRFAMSPLIGLRIPFFTFYPAIMASAAYGGLGSGLVCTVLSALIIAYYFLPPVGSFVISDVGDIVALGIFVLTGAAIAYLHETLHRRRAALAHVAEEAAAANSAKDEFLSILSHELRTPLTTILGWANLLRTRGAEPGVQAKAVAAIERGALAQAQIVEDVLDVSRIVFGQLRLNLGPTDVAAAFSAAVEVVRPTAEDKGVVLSAKIDPAGTIQGDAVRLQQIAWNLLVNAVKFTPRGGCVDVALRRLGGIAELTVTDNGEGIAPGFLPHVFERFRQADATSTRAHGGLGLGLAIVRHLVELHGGSVAAESAGPGKGATFRVRLPVSAGAPAKEEPGAEEGHVAEACLAGMRVLVVDDDLDTLDLVSRVLQERGATVAVAASAAEGIRALGQKPVDVLVADIDMPGEDGYSLMRRATALLASHGQKLPALALTACARVRDVEEATRAGFQAHVAKPVMPDHLVRIVAQLGAGRSVTNAG